MALIEKLLSLEGALTISALVAIRVGIRKLSLRGGKQRNHSHTVQGRDISGGVRVGSHDIISGRDTIYVDKIAERKTYKLLWSVLAVLLFLLLLSYPIVGKLINSELGTISFLMLMSSIYGLCTSVHTRGAEALSGIFYVAVALIIAYLANVDQPFFAWSADAAPKAIDHLSNCREALFSPLASRTYLFGALGAAVPECATASYYMIGAAGISGLFLSSCYIGFAHVYPRDFDEAVRFSANQVGFVLSAFVFASGAMMALAYQDTNYLLRLLRNTLDWQQLLS